MVQKQLDLPWHTSGLKDTSLQLISWNLRASRRKVLWVASFLWEGIIQAKSLLTDIFTLEFFQLSIHPDCFLSSEEKCLWKVMYFYLLHLILLILWGFFLKKKKKRKKSTPFVNVTALDIEVFPLPAEQMESYNASRANFPWCAVHLLSLIEARGKSFLNIRCINGCAGTTSISPLPLPSGKLCPHTPSVISTVEQAPTIRAGADFELPPLPGSCLRHKLLQPSFDVSDLWGWFWEDELDSMPVNPSSAPLERSECPGRVSLSQDCSARALCKAGEEHPLRFLTPAAAEPTQPFIPWSGTGKESEE